MPTPTVSEAFVMQYESEVHLAYQRQGAKLATTVRKKPGVVGEKVRFQKITTEAEAEEKSRHGDIPTQELTHAYVDATVKNWYAAFYADEDDLEKLNIDEKDALGKSGAYTCGRKIDSLIFTAADTTSIFVGTYTEAMSISMALAALDLLNDANVPDDGARFAVLSSHAFAELLCYEQFASADWVGTNSLPWTQGIKAKDWLGVNWIPHTGVPIPSAGQRTNFMYHKSALGLAQNSEVKARIEWDVRKDAWLLKHKVPGGTCLIDGNGVVEMRLLNTTAISTQMEKLIAATVANT